MERIELSDELNIGVDCLDEQHREIVGLLNELIDAFNGGNSWRGVPRLLNRVLGRVIAHFSYEEIFMLHHGYPDYERHKELHKEFMVKAEEFVEVIREEDGVLPEWLMIVFRSWFVDHVRGEDAKYRDFILAPTAKDWEHRSTRQAASEVRPPDPSLRLPHRNAVRV